MNQPFPNREGFFHGRNVKHSSHPTRTLTHPGKTLAQQHRQKTLPGFERGRRRRVGKDVVTSTGPVPQENSKVGSIRRAITIEIGL